MIVPGLRHEYWVGLSVTQAALPFDIALLVASLVALLAAGVGVGLGQASMRSPRRLDRAAAPPPPAPSHAPG